VPFAGSEARDLADAAQVDVVVRDEPRHAVPFHVPGRRRRRSGGRRGGRLRRIGRGGGGSLGAFGDPPEQAMIEQAASAVRIARGLLFSLLYLIGPLREQR